MTPLLSSTLIEHEQVIIMVEDILLVATVLRARDYYQLHYTQHDLKNYGELKWQNFRLEDST